jgi:hypothetical protein
MDLDQGYHLCENIFSDKVKKQKKTDKVDENPDQLKSFNSWPKSSDF